MEIEYRIADINDLDEICTLVSNAIDMMNKQNINQWDDLYPIREDFEEDIEKNQLYVGTIADQIAVIFVLNEEYDEEYESADWQHKEKAFYIIHRLCVNPAFQNKGIGKNALLYIEEKLRDMKIEAIRLDVFSENPYALKLYRNFGYSQRGYADWRKGRFYLMEKYL